MATVEDYSGQSPAWCPGCGNFAILKALKETLVELDFEPHQFMIVSGIGQAAKTPHYLRCNTFNGLHGRTLPVATGIRLSNHEMPVLVTTGDGDCYGEGGNHLVHAMRRNINVKLFVHDNQIYGLTKGQSSPTTMEGMVTKAQPFGSLSEALNPIAMAVALDCSFVARSFSGEEEHLKQMMKAAINHKGFALVDIFQPCVTFNKVNTFQWYRERLYRLGDDYDPHDRVAAFTKALEGSEKMPIGIIFRNTRPTLEEKIPVIKDTPLVNQPFSLESVRGEIENFF